MRYLTAAATFVLMTWPRGAEAVYTDTLPQGVFLVDARLAMSRTEHQWGSDGQLAPLLAEIERYEPGGGLQGTIVPNPRADLTILVNMLSYGLTDQVTLFGIVPVVLDTTVETRLGWKSGDYSSTLGRSFSETDFWDWAGSMGQPKPESWSGNNGALGDIMLGGRWCFTDGVDTLNALGLAGALTLYAAVPTGSSPDAEEIAAAGTDSWSLHVRGELGAHLSFEKRFIDELDGRLTLGLDLFHEVYFSRTHVAGTGEVHPLLLNESPYVGAEYLRDPGDLTGFELGMSVVLVEGPSSEIWLTKTPAALPPLLTVSLAYNLTLIGQSDWQSESELWDWEHEKLWMSGYKNIVSGVVTFSLLRLGAPLEIYAGLRSLTLLPGKNARAPNAFISGVRSPLKFW